MKRSRGFTLIEIAIGLMIMGLAAAGIIGVLSQQAEQRRIADTRARLAQARDALMAFVATRGRLPCPAGIASNGVELAVPQPPPPGTPGGTRFVCATEAGLLPAVTLGLPDLEPGGWFADGWRDHGNPPATLPRVFRYAVTPLAGDAQLTAEGLGFITNTRAAVRAAFDAGQGLFVCSSAVGVAGAPNRCGAAANELSRTAAAVVWSLGNNAADAAMFSADEQQNANMPVPRVVISRTFAPPGAVGGNFDDQVLWIPYTLHLDRLVSMGLVQ